MKNNDYGLQLMLRARNSIYGFHHELTSAKMSKTLFNQMIE